MKKKSPPALLVPLLLLAASSSSPSEAKVFDRCELARVLKANRMDSFGGGAAAFGGEAPTIEDWVCLAWGESRFNSSATGHLNLDGSVDHGIFQISDLYWCKNGKRGGACRQKCENFHDDDLRDDMKCARKIFYNHKYEAWVAWRQHCKGHPLESLAHCFDAEDKPTSDNIHNLLAMARPGIRAPPAGQGRKRS